MMNGGSVLITSSPPLCVSLFTYLVWCLLGSLSDDVHSSLYHLYARQLFPVYLPSALICDSPACPQLKIVDYQLFRDASKQRLYVLTGGVLLNLTEVHVELSPDLLAKIHEDILTHYA